MNYGGFFYASGVQGRGVFGQSEGSSGIGVKGWASNAGDVQNYGGYFTATGSRGIGVYGWAENEGDVENYGGYFFAAGQRGTGVYGEGSTFGVHGESNNWAVYGNGYIGVAGMGLKPRDGYSYGGYFDALGSHAVGVEGVARSEGDAVNYGGVFSAAGDSGRGVYGKATGNDGIGVYAEATGTNGTGIYAKGGPSGYAGYFDGDVEVRGDLMVSGSFFPRPAYDSGFLAYGQGESKTLFHDVGGDVEHYVVDLRCWDTAPPGIVVGINNIGAGGDLYTTDSFENRGALFTNLTATSITVFRGTNDLACEEVQVRIWVYK
jgi:hypothetical protein